MKPNLRRFRDAKTHLKAKSDLMGYLTDEMGGLVSEIENAFRDISFADNFNGRIVEVDVTALSETLIENRLGKIPTGYLQLDGDFALIKGNTWNKDWLTFTSTSYLYTVNGVTLSVSTGSRVSACDLEWV